MGAAANIALGPWSREGRMPGQMGMPDPMEMANQAMDLRNKQAQWQSQQNLTNILNASHGDANVARQLIGQDPMAAWMLPQVETWERAGLLAAQSKTQEFDQRKIAVDTAGANIKNGIDLQVHSLRMAGGNAQNYNNYMDAGLAGLAETNPVAAAELAPLVHTLKQASTGDLTGDQANQNRVFSQRAFTGLIGYGMPHESALAVTTGYVPFTGTAGGETVLGARGAAPGTLGQIMIPEGFQPGQSGVPGLVPGQPQGPPPTTGGEGGGGLQVPPQPPAGGGGGAGGGGIQLPPPQPPPAPTPASPVQPASAAQPAGDSWMNPPEIAAGQAGDGRPLYDPGNVPRTGPAVSGMPTLSGGAPLPHGEADANAKAIEKFRTETESFSAAQNNLGSLRQADADLNQLWKNGGFMTPGGGLEERTRVARNLNTLFQGLGLRPAFSPDVVGASEHLSKQLNTLTMSAAQTLFGGQREAASTIERIAKSVPGMDNSYLGNKILIGTIRATMQREIDQRNYINQWLSDPQHRGVIGGAAEAFNTQHPLNQYIDRELSQFGLDSSMQFKSWQDVQRDMRLRIMTPETGEKILRTQFGLKRSGEG